MITQNNDSSEADARIVVDRLLREASWDIEDKSQVTTEESIKDGRGDYLLLDSRSRSLAVVETKRFSKDPYTVKEQAEIYAKELQATFIFLSNGQDIGTLHDSKFIKIELDITHECFAITSQGIRYMDNQ